MSYPGVAYSRVCPIRAWRTLEYSTTKEECTPEFKSCLESVAAPTPAYFKWPTLAGKIFAICVTNEVTDDSWLAIWQYQH